MQQDYGEIPRTRCAAKSYGYMIQPLVQAYRYGTVQQKGIIFIQKCVATIERKRGRVREIEKGEGKKKAESIRVGDDLSAYIA